MKNKLCDCGIHSFIQLARHLVIVPGATRQFPALLQVHKLTSAAAIKRNGGQVLQLVGLYEPKKAIAALTNAFPELPKNKKARLEKRPVRLMFGPAVTSFKNGNSLDLRRENVLLEKPPTAKTDQLKNLTPKQLKAMGKDKQHNSASRVKRRARMGSEEGSTQNPPRYAEPAGTRDAGIAGEASRSLAEIRATGRTLVKDQMPL